MRANRVVWLCVVLTVAGCAAMRSKPDQPDAKTQPEATPFFTTVPTVPPTTPGPPQAAPLPTRPIRNPDTDQAKKAGKEVGPVVTHLGIARADGTALQPASTAADGTDIYLNHVGSGFMMLVETKPGVSNLEPGRRVLAVDPNDPLARPDLEIQVNKALGNGSAAVCDRRRPNIGGVPAINPPSFANTKKVADAENDLACRFETFIESASACTQDKHGDFSFVNPETKTQFCMIVAKAWAFPLGDTLVSVRLRDKEGNPGPVKKMILRHTAYVPPPRKEVTKTPTPSRRRP
jgi:hypothetical protein